jgi:hypothetical protein
MEYLKLVAFLAGIVVLGYFKRHGFRRAWYVLRTRAENPDWEKLGAEYFLSKKVKDRKE